MDNTKPGKEELRKSLQKGRLALGEEERHAKSEAIASTLLQKIYWPHIRNIHCFEPIMRLGEVDLVDFVMALQTDVADVRVYTSRKIGGEWKVVFTEDDKPVDEIPKFDVVIVPMLGFDSENLHRIGYGGGYYDRFLADQPQAKKVGVCYEAGLVEHLPAEPHDISLDMIVTEQNTYPESPAASETPR